MQRIEPKVSRCHFWNGPQDGYSADLMPDPEKAFTDLENKVRAIYERCSSLVPPIHYLFLKYETLDAHK